MEQRSFCCLSQGHYLNHALSKYLLDASEQAGAEPCNAGEGGDGSYMNHAVTAENEAILTRP